MAPEHVNKMPQGDVTRIPKNVTERARGDVKEPARGTKITGPASHRVGQLETDILADLLDIKNQLNRMEELLKQIHRKVMPAAA